MPKRAALILEDGRVFEGSCFGAVATACGEVVFDTGMTGYQEMLTDPSFAGQILVCTYPLIGNYGISESGFESGQVHVRGLAVREYCSRPSHHQSTGTLHQFLLARGIPGISGLDTRALTRHLRSAGVMMAVLTSDMTVDEALTKLATIPAYDATDFVRRVSTERAYDWNSGETHTASLPSFSLHGGSATAQSRIVVVDYGVKHSILRILSRLACRTTVVPCVASAEDILALNPDGIVLSPGPSNPELLDDMAVTVRRLIGRKPLMGICLGHQLIGRALGARTFKLKFGHRGGNHPVKDLATGRVYITSQNHGYAIDGEALGEGLKVSHVNLNDGTVEGLHHRDLPVLSVQYHCEAAPGPLDSMYLFERFLQMVGDGSG